jgi:hypothetical protein
MEESPFHSASASPSGLRSSRTELYPLNLQRPRVGQIKPPKWAKPTCQKHLESVAKKCVQCRTVLVQELAENRRLRQQLEELQAHCQRQEQELAELRSA